MRDPTVPEGPPTSPGPRPRSGDLVRWTHAPTAGRCRRRRAGCAVTDSLGFGGRRHRKAAIRMLLSQANRAMGAAERPGGGFAAWAMSQATPFLMRRAAGRVLVWVWKADPELLVVMAQVQEATPQLRAARATMPMEYDDTETFRGTYLGVGEKLAMPLPRRSAHAAVRDLHVGHRHALRDRHGRVQRPRAVRHGDRRRGRARPHAAGRRRPRPRRVADRAADRALSVTARSIPPAHRPVRIGVQLAPQHATYGQLRDAVLRAEDLGVDAIFNWDHFFPLTEPLDGAHFEAWTMLAVDRRAHRARRVRPSRQLQLVPQPRPAGRHGPHRRPHQRARHGTAG